MPIEPPKKKLLRPANHGPRVRREQRVMAALLHLFCRDHHQPAGDGLCPACADLLAFAEQRLAHCVKGELKEHCEDCHTNCYGRRRAEVQQVVDYAWPRLWRRQPLLALRHWLDRRRG